MEMQQTLNRMTVETVQRLRQSILTQGLAMQQATQELRGQSPAGQRLKVS